MKKRLVAVLLFASLALTACGGVANTDTQANSPSTETESQMATEAVDKTETESITETTEVAETTEITETTESESENTPADNGKDDKKDEPKDSEEPKEPKESESEEKEPEAPTYTYTDMNTTMYCTYSCNIRSLPSTEGNIVGKLEIGTMVIVTGKCNETGWYRFEYNGKDAYVTNSYLSTEQPSAPEEEEDDDIDLKDGESWTDEEGYTYYNWNGYIIKMSPRSGRDQFEVIKGVCYADYYQIVMYGNRVGMKLPHGNDSVENFRRTEELRLHIESMGYREVRGGGGTFSENTDDHLIWLDFE